MRHSAHALHHAARSEQRAALTASCTRCPGQRSAPTKSTFRTSICVPMREPNGDSANGTDPYLSERKAAQIEADSYGARATGRSRCLRLSCCAHRHAETTHRAHDSKSKCVAACVWCVRIWQCVQRDVHLTAGLHERQQRHPSEHDPREPNANLLGRQTDLPRVGAAGPHLSQDCEKLGHICAGSGAAPPACFARPTACERACDAAAAESAG